MAYVLRLVGDGLSYVRRLVFLSSAQGAMPIVHCVRRFFEVEYSREQNSPELVYLCPYWVPHCCGRSISLPFALLSRFVGSTRVRPAVTALDQRIARELWDVSAAQLRNLGVSLSS